MRMSDLHSMRLFPRMKGALAYRLTGIAARCDWVVLSDRMPPHVNLLRLAETDTPRRVFLSMRHPNKALRFFVRSVLPMLSSDFVLVSGSEDATVPRQMDRRWPLFDDEERGLISELLAHPLLQKWFAENLDSLPSPKMAPVPTGMVFPDDWPAPDQKLPTPPPLSSRPPRVFCAHNVREGDQWEPRKRVTALSRGPWSAFCTVLEQRIPEPEYLRRVSEHAFVACVEGGGLDPSPKAWQTILHGAIPIIRRSALDAAYSQLPVAFVDEWMASEITPERLDAWQKEFAPLHDEAGSRAEVLRRLGIDYWWEQIVAGKLHVG